MAKDLDDGYTRIANEVLEDLAKCKNFCVKSRVVLAILRNTWGWKGHPKERLLSQTYLAEATGASVDSVKRALHELSTAGMIKRERSMTGYNKYWTEGGADLHPSAVPHQDESAPEGGADPTQNLVQGCTTKKEKKEKRKKIIVTDLPEDAKMTDQMHTKAVEHGMVKPEEIDFQWEKFKAHHQARGNKFKRWDRAWLTWVLNWKKWDKQNRKEDTIDGNRKVFENAVDRFIKPIA